MGYYYLETEKKNVKNFPKELKYLVINEIPKPNIPYGKKRPTQKDQKEYNEKLKKQNNFLKQLESGHVNMNNNYFVLDNIEKEFINYAFIGNRRLFYIEPIQSNTRFNEEIVVSEFNCREIKTEDELIEHIVKNYLYYGKIPKEIFKYGCFDNIEYREKSIELIKKFNKIKGSKFHLYDLINKTNFSFSNESFAENYGEKHHKYALYLINNNLVELITKYEPISSYIEKLLRLQWYDIALLVLNSEFLKDKDVEEIKNNLYIKSMLATNSDVKEVKEIINMIKIDTGIIKLKVEENYDDGYSERVVEEKEFTDMNDLRSYLVTEYKIPFNLASGEIDGLCCDEYTFTILQ